jgi:hypothetical protein
VTENQSCIYGNGGYAIKWPRESGSLILSNIQRNFKKAVFRIHEILGWIRIRIRGSMRIRILLFLLLTLKMPAKKLIFNTFFSAYLFLKVHLQDFSKIKSQKAPQNSRNQGFSYYFCMMIEGSGSRAGSGSIPLTSGSGSGRPKNMWDPEHCKKESKNL